MAAEPIRALIDPIIMRNVKREGVIERSSKLLIRMKAPMLIIPACIKAETGVGASIVSGSHVLKGKTADFVSTAKIRKRFVRKISFFRLS